MSGAATTETILIDVANMGAGLKSGLGLRVNSLLHKFFETIELLAALFDFDLDLGLQAFAEVANYCIFYRSLFRIKFE